MRLVERFIASFRKAILAEMQAMQERLGSFEVPVSSGRALESGAADRRLFAFEIAAPNDKLALHSECTFATARDEWLVTIEGVAGREIRLSCGHELPLGSGPAVLVIYPWFLYQRLLAALESLPASTGYFVENALMVFGKRAPTMAPRPIGSEHEELNASQQRAVQLCADSNCAFVWGPPGTGKTTTLGHIVVEMLAQGHRILVTSTTNAAVDQALAKLAELGAAAGAFERGEVLRLGHTEAETFGADLATVVTRLNRDTQSRLEAARERREVCRHLRAACDRLLDALGETGGPVQLDLFRTVPPPRLRAQDLTCVVSAPMAAHVLAQAGPRQREIVLRRKARLERVRALCTTRMHALARGLRRREAGAVQAARVILSTMTNTTINRLLRGERFDVVVIEEAGMAILPTLFYCAALARHKVIMVGDPKQLPPIVQSRDEYVRRAMGRSIFDVTVPDSGSADTVVMLDTQYRMHPVIGGLVSNLFYGGALRHGDDTAERSRIAARKPFPGAALVVVDTAGTTVCSVQDGGYSRFNERSAQLCVELALEGVRDGIESVAVITPYVEQSRLVRRLLGKARVDAGRVECRTVHRFQGNERDMVILDTVDTEPMQPGVLLAGSGRRSSAPNLINVSVSRARGKLVVIADVAYFESRCPESVMTRMLRSARTDGEAVPLDGATVEEGTRSRKRSGLPPC